MSGDLVGTTLGGRFDVIGFIAMGGMGAVYRARDRDLDEIVALKVIRDDLVANASVIERFRHEVKLARRVTHHNVARTYELGSDGEITYCTMELIDGAPLTRRMLVQGMVVGEVAAIASALCSALEAAHHAGVIHRDVKPDNVLVAHDGRVVLTDFGIAAVGHNETEWGGTPRYMAPEQARGEQPTPLADIYALGVMVYEMLAGRPAFEGNPIEILAVKQDVEHLVLEGDFDPEIVEIVKQVTAFDPARRPPTAAMLRNRLAPWVSTRAMTEPQTFAHVDDHVVTVVVRPAPNNEHDTAHLAFGFRQALMTRLARIPLLRVTLNDSGDPEHTIAELAASPDALRLSLTRPDDRAALALDVSLDPATLLHEVERATRVVSAMVDIRLPPLAPERPLVPEALELILRARHAVYRDRGLVEQALKWCERAVHLAPDDPRVLAIYAKRLSELAFMTPDAEGSGALLSAAAQSVRKSQARDPRGAEARVVAGQLELHNGDPVAAAVHFRAAIASEPLLADAHHWLGRMLVESGYLVDAFKRFADAASLSVAILAGWGERVRALALEGEWLEVDSIVARAGVVLGKNQGQFTLRLRLIVWRGQYAGYDADLLELRNEIASSSAADRGMLAMSCDHMRGVVDMRAMLAAHLQSLENASARRRALVCQLAAEIAGRVDDRETVLHVLERATTDGMFDLHWLDRCPLLAVARDHERFAALRAVVEQRANAIHDALFGEQPVAEKATAFSAYHQVSHAATVVPTS
ncbi:MAG: protein kinase [Kofleriaceae bacterium]